MPTVNLIKLKRLRLPKPWFYLDVFFLNDTLNKSTSVTKKIITKNQDLELLAVLASTFFRRVKKNIIAFVKKKRKNARGKKGVKKYENC